MAQLKTNQQVALSLAFTTDAGQPAPRVDGVPKWSSSDEAIVTVVPAADGLTATAVAQAIGTAVISVTADADLGAGVREITDTEDFEILADDEAAVVTINVGSPEPKA